MASNTERTTACRLRLGDLRVKKWDLIVIGAGPAGSSCAALCAKAGMKVLLLESARFPRDKVCGDCLNPAVWPILDSLGISQRVQGLPNSSPGIIRFTMDGQRSVEIPLLKSSAEVVIRRREFDALLVERSIELGAVFQDGIPITSLQRVQGEWHITTAQGVIGSAPVIVAADGRNSSVARHLRMLSSPIRDDRVGIQTQISHPEGYDGALEMHLYQNGYGGLADLGQGQANLCLVSNAGAMRQLRKEAEDLYQVNPAIAWRSIIPISRPQARSVARDGVFLCGDAACVVEPFTGEGIAFALRTGSQLARILISPRESLPGDREKIYTSAHRQIYRGKLAINHLTRFLSQHPRLAHSLAPLLFRFPGVLSLMARKVIR